MSLTGAGGSLRRNGGSGVRLQRRDEQASRPPCGAVSNDFACKAGTAVCSPNVSPLAGNLTARETSMLRSFVRALAACAFSTAIVLFAPHASAQFFPPPVTPIPDDFRDTAQ